MVSCHHLCFIDGKEEALEEGVWRARLKFRFSHICSWGLALLISRMGEGFPPHRPTGQLGGPGSYLAVLTLAAHHHHPRRFKNDPIQRSTSDQPHQGLGDRNPALCVAQMSPVSLRRCQVASHWDKDVVFSKPSRPCTCGVQAGGLPSRSCSCSWGRGRVDGRFLGVTIPPFTGLGAISLFDSLSTLPRTSVPSEEGSRELAVTGACWL